MSLVIFDEIVRASGLSEEELLVEVVLLLFKEDKISLGKAAELLNMSQIRFQGLLGDRGRVHPLRCRRVARGYSAFHCEGVAVIIVSDTHPLLKSLFSIISHHHFNHKTQFSCKILTKAFIKPLEFVLKQNIHHLVNR